MEGNGFSTGCKLPRKVVSILDAGVHSKAASWREAVRCVACQKCIANLQQTSALIPYSLPSLPAVADV